MSTESPKSRTQDVLVHKATIPLMKDESLRAFTSVFKKAGRDHLMQKFNIEEKKGSVWPVEIFANKAVFMVVPDFQKPPVNDFHVAVKFIRADTGQFTFTDTMKVTPVTTFVSNTGEAAAKVSKAMDMEAWVKAESEFAGVL